MNLKSNKRVACEHPWLRQDDNVLPVHRKPRENFKQVLHSTHLSEILQYRGQGKQNTPTSTSTHTSPCWQGSADNFIKTATSYIFPNPAFQSTSLYRQTLWFQPFHGKSGQREGNVEISHTKCTRAHMILMLASVTCARTHSITQTIHYIKCFKKYR